MKILPNLFGDQKGSIYNCPSVCFDTVISYLAHLFITIRGCVTYIHDPDTTLIFDLKIKYIGFLTCLQVRPVISVCFDICLPCLEQGSITMRGYVAYIHNPNTTLTFDPKVKFIGFLTWLCVRTTFFCPLTYSYHIWHMMFM